MNLLMKLTNKKSCAENDMLKESTSNEYEMSYTTTGRKRDVPERCMLSLKGFHFMIQRIDPVVHHS